MALPKTRLWVLTDWRMDGQMDRQPDGRTIPSTLSPSFAVDKESPFSKFLSMRAILDLFILSVLTVYFSVCYQDLCFKYDSNHISYLICRTIGSYNYIKRNKIELLKHNVNRICQLYTKCEDQSLWKCLEAMSLTNGNWQSQYALFIKVMHFFGPSASIYCPGAARIRSNATTFWRDCQFPFVNDIAFR